MVKFNLKDSIRDIESEAIKDLLEKKKVLEHEHL